MDTRRKYTPGLKINSATVSIDPKNYSNGRESVKKKNEAKIDKIKTKNRKVDKTKLMTLIRDLARYFCRKTKKVRENEGRKWSFL